MKFTCDKIKMNYDDFGQGPVVIFAPEEHWNSQIWNAHVGPLITAGYRVILLEFLEETSMDACCQAVIKLLNYLGIGRAAVCGMQDDKLLLKLITDFPQRIACACQMTDLVNRETVQAINRPDSNQVSEINIPYETGGEATRQLINFLSIFTPRKTNRPPASLANAA